MKRLVSRAGDCVCGGRRGGRAVKNGVCVCSTVSSDGLVVWIGIGHPGGWSCPLALWVSMGALTVPPARVVPPAPARTMWSAARPGPARPPARPAKTSLRRQLKRLDA